MKKWYKTLLLCCILFGYLFPYSIYAADASITLNPAKKTYSIPKNFLGISVAQNAICDVAAEHKQSPVLAQLLKNLSPAILRVGGSSVETAFWKPNAATCNNSTLTPALVDSIISLVKQSNWKLLWGLPLKDVSSADIAAESTYLINHATDALYALELSNEPDFIMDYATYIDKWTQGVRAIHAKNPDVPISGPSDTGKFIRQFVNERHNSIMLATTHSYPAGGRDAANANEASEKRAIMLSAETMKAVATATKARVEIAKAKNLAMRYSEANSISGGGTPGASDTFTAAIWGVDYLFTVLEQGAVGVNFHSRIAANPNATFHPPIYYSPINNASTDKDTFIPYATPLYYAMLLFKYAASDGYVVPVSLNTNLNIAAHAVINTDGKVRLVIINKEANKPVSVEINTTQSYKSAQLIHLAAPSLTTTITSQTESKVTLGGASVTANGTWKSHTPQSMTVNGAKSTITVSPANVALITYSTSPSSPSPTTAPKKLLGDLNNDKKVNIKDYNILMANFGKKGTKGWIASDIIQNGKVNIFDYNAVIENLGKTQ